MNLTKKCIAYGVAAISIGSLAISCSSGGGGSAIDKSSIAAVPKATGAVDGAGAKAMTQFTAQGYMSEANSTLATTGLPLKSWGKSSLWTAGKSRGMCETGLLMRDALREAMNPDKIACYIGSIHKTGGFGSLTIDSGEYVYLKLKDLPDQTPGTEPRIKMKVVKTAGVITQFEMFSCFANNGATQTEYLNAEIANGTGNVSSKNIGSEGTQSWAASVATTGTLDSDYKWNSKSLVIERAHSDTNASESFSQKATITQNIASFIVEGYNVGSQGTGATKNFFTNKFYTVIEGLNMTTPKNLALGDGSSKYVMDWCIDDNTSNACDGGDTDKFNQSSTDSWTGDDLAKLGAATDGTHYTQANAGTVPASTPAVAVSFTADETWDCNAASFTEIDLSNFSTPSTPLGAAIVSCHNEYEYSDDSDATGSYPCGDAR